MNAKSLSQAAFLVVLVLVALVSASACATGGMPPGVPLPPSHEINIVPPGPEVPKSLAALSGAWTGTWQPGAVDFVLIVLEIKPAGALVIYARSGNNPGYWRRVAYPVDEGKALRLEISEAGITMTFMPANGWLKGEYKSHRASASASLAKISWAK